MGLVIQNNGRGAAYDVRFKINPDFECRKSEFLSSYPFMQHIMYLAPGQRLRCFLASAVEVLQRETGKAFTISALYKSEIGQPYEEDFYLDFEHFRGMTRIGTPPAHKIADMLEKIQRDIGHAISGFNHLNVEVWTQADMEKKRDEHERWREDTLSKLENKTDSA